MAATKQGEPRDIVDRTFQFAVRIVRLCQTLDETPGTSRNISRQLLRAETSIGANVEEARAGQSTADFINKNAIALKEARETMYWIRLFMASKVIAADRVAELKTEADEIARVLGAIIVSAKRKNEAGEKCTSK